MGGAILKFKEEGLRVGILELTNGEPTPHGTPEIRANETAAATTILGVDWRDNLGLPNRSLEPTLEARAQLAGVIRQRRPRWLFAPYWIDAHPDHVAATRLVEDARFWAKLSKTDLPGEPHHPQRIYHYYAIHLKQAPQPAFVLDITEQWERKLAAISCYHSQFIEGRPQQSPTMIDRFRDEASDRHGVWRAICRPRTDRSAEHGGTLLRKCDPPKADEDNRCEVLPRHVKSSWC
jgi:bacillithiol biosynthesis deacetylase BshB1